MSGTKLYEFDDPSEFLEAAYERGWTDGLPVVPPTRDRVSAMIDHIRRDPDDLVGLVPPIMGRATIEKIAIQAAMAGCKPEYFPVVVAAVEAMLAEDDDQHFNLKGLQDSSHPATPLVIVCGPAVTRLGFNYRENVFGGSCRANATVGRAVRLVLWNLGGGREGVTDMTHLGHPGKLSFCIAENPHPEENPWVTLNVEAGHTPTDSTVTVIAAEAPRGILTFSSDLGDSAAHLTPDRILIVLGKALASPGSHNYNTMGQALVVIGPYTARILADGGYDKEDVRRALFEKGRNRISYLIEEGLLHPTGRNSWWVSKAPWLDLSDPNATIPVVESLENIHIIVTGGNRLPWNAICHGWGQVGGYAVTRRIDLPQEGE